ncbi:unnamed protein product, partial [Dibothriocephalus latus]
MSDTLANLKRRASRKVVELYHLECTPDTYAPNDTKLFASKYKIRDILFDLLDMLKQSGDDLTSSESTLLWSFFNLKLATTFIETEEKQEAPSSYHDADEKNTDAESTALYWLRRAEAVFRIYSRVFGGAIRGSAPECWESLGFFDSLDVSNPGTDKDTTELVKEIMFETGYTTTLFMLAQ